MRLAAFGGRRRADVDELGDLRRPHKRQTDYAGMVGQRLNCAGVAEEHVDDTGWEAGLLHHPYGRQGAELARFEDDRVAGGDGPREIERDHRREVERCHDRERPKRFTDVLDVSSASDAFGHRSLHELGSGRGVLDILDRAEQLALRFRERLPVLGSDDFRELV